MSLPVLDDLDINFAGSTVFMDRTRSFIIPVAKLTEGGEPLLSPDDGSPLREDPEARGVVFHDGSTDTWKGVLGDGSEAIVLKNFPSTGAVRALYIALQHSFPLLNEVNPERYGFFLNWVFRVLDTTDISYCDLVTISLENIHLDRTPHFAAVTGPFGHMECKKMTPYRAAWVPNPFILKRGENLTQCVDGGVLVSDGTMILIHNPNVFRRNWCGSNDGVEYPLPANLSEVSGLPMITVS